MIDKIFGKIIEYLYNNNLINAGLIREILCNKCAKINNCLWVDNIPWCFEKMKK